MKKLVLAGLIATQLMWGQSAPLRMLCSNGVRGAILELKADWEFLMKLWRNIQATSRKTSAPALIHQDLTLI